MLRKNICEVKICVNYSDILGFVPIYIDSWFDFPQPFLIYGDEIVFANLYF